jgi:hypothetical protein
MKTINTIIVHCSDLPYGTAEGIRRYHIDQLGWADIGYHLVAENGRASKSAPYVAAQDGALERGRDLDGDGDILEETGAHALGYNEDSLGLCLIGRKGTFTTRQMRNVIGYIAGLCHRLRLPASAVLGHYETEHEQAKPERHPDPRKRRKTCPDLDMVSFRRAVQDALHVLEMADLAAAAVAPFEPPESEAE